MAFTRKKIYTDPIIGDVLIKKDLRTRRITLKIHPTKGTTLTMPFFTPYSTAIQFIEEHKQWIQDRLQKITIPKYEIETLRSQAKSILPNRIATLAQRYGFTYNKITIKHNSSNWGSCSSKNNINLNLNLIKIPEHLCDYVLLHELCHLKHHDHGEQFHTLLESLCSQHFQALTIAKTQSRYPILRTLEKELKQHRLI